MTNAAAAPDVPLPAAVIPGAQEAAPVRMAEPAAEKLVACTIPDHAQLKLMSVATPTIILTF